MRKVDTKYLTIKDNVIFSFTAKATSDFGAKNHYVYSYCVYNMTICTPDEKQYATVRESSSTI